MIHACIPWHACFFQVCYLSWSLLWCVISVVGWSNPREQTNFYIVISLMWPQFVELWIKVFETKHHSCNNHMRILCYISMLETAVAVAKPDRTFYQIPSQSKFSTIFNVSSSNCWIHRKSIVKDESVIHDFHRFWFWTILCSFSKNYSMIPYFYEGLTVLLAAKFVKSSVISDAPSDDLSSGK